MMQDAISRLSSRTPWRLLLLAVVSSSYCYSPQAFVVTPNQPQRNVPCISRHTSRGATQLSATAELSSFDEKEKTNKNGVSSNSDDWTPTRGGFLPNIRQQRSSPVKQPDIVVRVKTIEEYKREVVEEPDRMVVVRFYAPWCRSCKAMAPLFIKMAKEHSPQIKFVEVPVTKDNAYLHEGLGVPSFPFGHIYHPEVGLVEERKVNKKVFGEFKKVLQTYVDGYCNVPQDGDESAFE